MAAFAFISDVVSVQASCLKQPVQPPLVQVADRPSHEKYFQCICTNHPLKTLIVDDRFVWPFGSVAKALCHTDILKKLKQMKDDAWRRQVEACTGVGVEPPLKREEWRSKVLSFPTTVAIVAPEVSTVGSKTLMVQLTPRAKVW